MAKTMDECKLIAVDFDGTLCTDAYPLIGEANLHLINLLKNVQKKGCKLILWTCRSGLPLEDAIAWCGMHGLYFDAVNQNVPEIIERYGHDSRKITADLYVDDRAADCAQLIS